MAILQANVLVRAPLERVYRFTTDPGNLGRWLHPVEALSDMARWPSPGATFRFRWRFLGMSGGGDGRVSRLEHQRRFTCDTRCDLGQATWDLEWQRRGHGCRLTVTVNYQGAPLLAGTGLDTLSLQQLLYRHLELSLHSLRLLAEQGARSGCPQPGDPLPVLPTGLPPL